MSLFDWFRGTPRNVTVCPDVIWLNHAAMLKVLARSLVDAVTQRVAPDAALLVAHFPDRLEELEKVGEIVRPSLGKCPLLVASARRCDDKLPARLPAGQSGRLLLLVGERHPLIAHDEAIVAFAGTLSCRTEIVHHLSLEDAVLRSFAGEWVAKTLKSLGMTETEAIASPMVSRRLLDTQRKLAREAIGDRPAESAEAWMELNCPSGWIRGQR